MSTIFQFYLSIGISVLNIYIYYYISEDDGILHLSCGKFSVKITVDVNRALEIEARCGIRQFCVCLRVIDSVKRFVKRQATFFHQHKYEVSYSAFVHIV